MSSADPGPSPNGRSGADPAGSTGRDAVGDGNRQQWPRPGSGDPSAFCQEDFLSAHAAGDLERLVDLYGRLGAARIDAGAIDAGCFYLTQAYVFALEAGDSRAERLHRRLKSHGREE